VNYTKDIIESVVTAMKSSGTIDAITEVTDVWTIETSDTGNLKDDFKIKIGSYYYRVSSLVEDTSFVVETTRDLSEETTWEMYFNFGFGGKEEIINDQTLKGSNSKEAEKFDLIWLFDNISSSYPDEKKSYERTDSIEMALVTDSLKSKTSEWRLTNRFKTRLNPIFELFRAKLIASDYIVTTGNKLGFDSQDWYNYKDPQNVMNQNCDAIEFQVSINIKKEIITNC